jgi:hypothetical protein
MIDQNTYLQVDATAIAGVFILLTIGSAFKFEDMRKNMIYKIFGHEFGYTLYSIVLIMCAPFSLSAIFVIADSSIFPDFTSTNVFHFMFIYMYETMSALGFVYIIWMISIISKIKK